MILVYLGMATLMLIGLALAYMAGIRLARRDMVMRAIVARVAKSNPYGSWLPATNTPPGVVCRWCMQRAQTPQQCQHDLECTWVQACALLATPEGEGKG